MIKPKEESERLFPNLQRAKVELEEAHHACKSATAAIRKATSRPLREAMKTNGPLQQELREARERYYRAQKEYRAMDQKHPVEVAAYRAAEDKRLDEIHKILGL